jgi:hypothetical protein
MLYVAMKPTYIVAMLYIATQPFPSALSKFSVALNTNGTNIQ